MHKPLDSQEQVKNGCQHRKGFGEEVGAAEIE